MKTHLFTPGPVNIPEDILALSAQQPLSHRSLRFFQLMEEIQTKLSTLLRSDGPVVILPSSGTGALEALCSNLIERGDRVLSVSCGVFGDRFREIARLQGAEIIPLDIPCGCKVDPVLVHDALNLHKGIKAVLLTHNETSTGVLNPVEKITESISSPEAPLVLVDAVSSLGAMPCFPEKWNIDGLASCSQKGLLTPPGLGVVWLSPKAWEHQELMDNKRSYYFDLSLHRKYLDKKDPQNPFTPPVSLLETLDRSLSMILDEGPEGWFGLRKRLSGTFLAGITAMGLRPFVEEVEARSPGVSSVLFPENKAEGVRKSLENVGVIASGGQGALKGRVMRFAHYSQQQWPEIAMLLGCLYGALDENGIVPFPGYISSAWSAWKEGK